MAKNEGTDLGKLARKITGLRTFTRLKLKSDGAMKPHYTYERWSLVKDWAKECWNELTGVMAGFYPRRLVRRLQRTLRQVEGILQRRMITADGTKLKVAELSSDKGVQVLGRPGEASLFASLMAAPRGNGQLLC